MRRWRKLTNAEFDDVMNVCRSRKGGIFNGCLWAELIARYGAANVVHRDWRHTMKPNFYVLKKE